jgi:hypothetical protein
LGDAARLVAEKGGHEGKELSMVGLHRLIAVLVPVSFLTAVGEWGSPCFRRVGRELCQLPALTWTFKQERLRQKDLGAKVKAARTRLCRQTDVAEAVIEGRLTLLEAAACFRDLRASEPPDQRKVARRAFPAQSEQEWLCRLVIRFVKVMLQDKPGVPASLAARLEEELRQHLRRGPLSLPPPERVKELLPPPKEYN